MTGNELLIESIGYIATIINTVSVLPQIVKTYKSKDVSSLSLSFLLYWVIGCGLFLIYTLLTDGTLPVILSYALNTVFPSILIVLYLKYRK